MQVINPNQLEHKVNDTYRKDGKITTKIETVNYEDVLNNGYPDTKINKIESPVPFIKKDYIEFKLCNDKQSEEVLSEKAMETTIQKLYGRAFFFYNFVILDEVLEDYLHIERRRPDLIEVNFIVVFRRFSSSIYFKK